MAKKNEDDQGYAIAAARFENLALAGHSVQLLPPNSTLNPTDEWVCKDMGKLPKT